MSERRIPSTQNRSRDTLRDLEERIYRLENGGATAGLISFGDAIQVGDVEIRVTDAGGQNRNLVFRNVLTGATSTINL